MANLVKKLRNGGAVTFGEGSFDEWCVFLTVKNGYQFPPKDLQYFARLQKLGRQQYGEKVIYTDFVRIYEQTSAQLDSAVLSLIDDISDQYSQHIAEMEAWFTVLYAGMIAEENKRFAKLKKRIKRLGMHQTLLEHATPQRAANFSKGKKWRELDAIMKAKGF